VRARFLKVGGRVQDLSQQSKVWEIQDLTIMVVRKGRKFLITAINGDGQVEEYTCKGISEFWQLIAAVCEKLED